MTTLVLAGAGHAHLLFIRQWCKKKLPGMAVTLVSPQSQVLYSGMLPAYLAGHYLQEDIHIDLVALCNRAGVQLILDEVTGIDTASRNLLVAASDNIAFDLLSLNTGPAADSSVPGVAEHALPVKPVSRFLPHWQQLQDTLRVAEAPLHIVMVGGGAGSVETLLGMALAIHKDTAIQTKPHYTLLSASPGLLPDHPPLVARAALRRCRELGISVLLNKRVRCVEQGHLFCDDSKADGLSFDALLWCTDAAAPRWLQASGLALDERGFVQVNAFLQSSDPAIFAAGDVASFIGRTLPKSGVVAVRQAPVLQQNLCSTAQGKALRAYLPRSRYLSLLYLGEAQCAGSYGRIAASGSWLWHWKQRIDLDYMRSFSE
jgi:selenide, water dikinase